MQFHCARLMALDASVRSLANSSYPPQLTVRGRRCGSASGSSRRTLEEHSDRFGGGDILGGWEFATNRLNGVEHGLQFLVF